MHYYFISALRFTLYIAFRYLFSPKKQNFINVISALSALAVCFISAALIIVLSAFNGLENLVLSLYNSFDPDIKITANVGKSFEADSSLILKISEVEGFRKITPVVEENALLMYNERQFIGTVKGVGEQFFDMTGLDSLTIEGDAAIHTKWEFQSKANDSTLTPVLADCAVLGAGIASSLGIDLNNSFQKIQLFFPKRGRKVDMFQPFRNTSIAPCGVFAIQQDFDHRYIIVPLDFAAYLFDLDNKWTALEIDLDSGADFEQAKEKIQHICGSNFRVQTRFEQHALLYKIMKTERLAVFLILSFILLIASFNIVGAITMLMVEKKKDAMVLWSLGLNEKSIRRIYFLQGLLISASGALIGLVAGLLICYGQLQLGWIKINSNPEAPAYPVQVNPKDIFLTLITVLLIGALASWFRARTFSLTRNLQLGLLK